MMEWQDLSGERIEGDGHGLLRCEREKDAL